MIDWKTLPSSSSFVENNIIGISVYNIIYINNKWKGVFCTHLSGSISGKITEERFGHQLRGLLLHLHVRIKRIHRPHSSQGAGLNCHVSIKTCTSNLLVRERFYVSLQMTRSLESRSLSQVLYQDAKSHFLCKKEDGNGVSGRGPCSPLR